MTTHCEVPCYCCLFYLCETLETHIHCPFHTFGSSHKFVRFTRQITSNSVPLRLSFAPPSVSCPSSQLAISFSLAYSSANFRIFPFHPVFVLPVLVELIEFSLFHLVFFFPDLSVLIEFVRLVAEGKGEDGSHEKSSRPVIGCYYFLQ